MQAPLQLIHNSGVLSYGCCQRISITVLLGSGTKEQPKGDGHASQGSPGPRRRFLLICKTMTSVVLPPPPPSLRALWAAMVIFDLVDSSVRIFRVGFELIGWPMLMF